MKIMKSLKDTFTLYNGVEIPCVGYGTWQVKEGAEGLDAVKEALLAGYRHIDTASGYGNEESVGRAIKESGIERSEIFVTSKLKNPDHGYEATKNAFELTMKKLDLDYLDLYLIHWPNPVMFRDNWKEANAGSWKAFEEFYQEGRIRSIGISNFQIHHIEALLETAKIVPMVNQIRLCPGDTQEELVTYCRNKQILLEAYSPLGTGKVFDVPQMKALATKYNKSIAQLCLKWSLQRGYLPLPKSISPERIKENGALFDFELSESDVVMMAELVDSCGMHNDPDHTTF
jgi:diketogulonate reductase-like aldo/keto reductase